MRTTKLILIEGPPGSGKSTTAQLLADDIAREGHACQCFYEWSADHPIPIGDDSNLGQVIATAIALENEELQHWQQFVQANRNSDRITVLESRFWQTGVMLTYIGGHPVERIKESNQRVIAAIRPLQPVLIYFEIDPLRVFIERTIRIKEAEWQQAGIPDSWAEHIYRAFEPQPWFQQRGLTGLEGMVAFLEEWAAIAHRLYAELPFPKVKIRNPHENWPRSMQQMRDFVGLSE